jgi:hypothetical protein
VSKRFLLSLTLALLAGIMLVLSDAEKAKALSCAPIEPARYDLIFLGKVIDVRDLPEQDNPQSIKRRAWMQIVSLYKGTAKSKIEVYYTFVEPWGPTLIPGEQVWIYANRQQDTGEYHFSVCGYGSRPPGR